MLLSKTPVSSFSQSKVKGNMFGIELECEFPVQMPENFMHDFGKGYKVVPDGSLRGNGLEFISPPIAIENKKHMDQLENLCEAILRVGGPQNSPRTSTHVHQNWNSNTLGELFTFISVYTLVEPVLLFMSGDYRIGNNFCLSFAQAPLGFNKYISYARENFWNIGQNNRTHKYSALHVGNLAKIGTIEFRSMKGIHSTKQVLDWLKTLSALKEYSLTFKSPAEVKERFDRIGYADFVSEALLEPDPVLGSHSEIEEAIARFYCFVESSSDNWTWDNDWRHNPKQYGFQNFDEVFKGYIGTSNSRVKPYLFNNAEKDRRRSMPTLIGDFIDDVSQKKPSLFDTVPYDYNPYIEAVVEQEDRGRVLLRGLMGQPPAVPGWALRVPVQPAPPLPHVNVEFRDIPEEEGPQFHNDDEDDD